MTAAVVAVATVLTALVGLVLYVLKQRDSPTAQRASAQKQVDETKRAWEQARQEISEAIRFHLEGLKEDGLQAPEPQASVSPAPLSHSRSRMRSGARI